MLDKFLVINVPFAGACREASAYVPTCKYTSQIHTIIHMHKRKVLQLYKGVNGAW